MEQSNYNRGGYRGGRNTGGGYRGGRNQGGRGSFGGGPHDGGRGEGGRGIGGGGYPRGGGNRNYPQQQQFTNQQQEQYGAGRGRGSGGRVATGGGGAAGGRGGQQTYPTPNFRRPDRVPDRSGADREVTSWNRVETQKAIADLKIQDGVEGAYEPIKRPDPVKFDPSNSILRYDVDVKQDAPPASSASSSTTRAVKKSIPKLDLRLILEKLCSDYPEQFPLLQTAYDGEKNIFSAVLLKGGTYNVNLFGRSYTCPIKYGCELNLSGLQDFLTGNATQVPRDVLQALEGCTRGSIVGKMIFGVGLLLIEALKRA